MNCTPVSLQELANQQARRAVQAERRLESARRDNANLRARIGILEQQIEQLRDRPAPTLGRYHRYWIRRFTPEQVIELARGMSD